MPVPRDDIRRVVGGTVDLLSHLAEARRELRVDSLKVNAFAQPSGDGHREPVEVAGTQIMAATLVER